MSMSSPQPKSETPSTGKKSSTELTSGRRQALLRFMDLQTLVNQGKLAVTDAEDLAKSMDCDFETITTCYDPATMETTVVFYRMDGHQEILTVSDAEITHRPAPRLRELTQMSVDPDLANLKEFYRKVIGEEREDLTKYREKVLPPVPVWKQIVREDMPKADPSMVQHFKDNPPVRMGIDVPIPAKQDLDPNWEYEKIVWWDSANGVARSRMQAVRPVQTSYPQSQGIRFKEIQEMFNCGDISINRAREMAGLPPSPEKTLGQRVAEYKEALEKLASTPGSSPSTPGTTSTSTPQWRERSSYLTNNDWLVQDSGPKPSSE